MGCDVARRIHAAAYIEVSALTAKHVEDLFTLALLLTTNSVAQQPRQRSKFSLENLWNTFVPRSILKPKGPRNLEWEALYLNCTATRYGHAQVLHGTILSLIGGSPERDSDTAGDITRFDYSQRSWLQPITPFSLGSPNLPSTLNYMTFFASTLIDAELMFIFGGCLPSVSREASLPEAHCTSCATNTLSRLNLKTGELSFLAVANNVDSPSSRYGSTMIIWSRNLYIFAGCSSTGICSDLFCYNLDNCLWTKVSINNTGRFPSARCHHTAVCYKSSMIVFGGIVNERSQNDLWTLDLLSTTWLKPSTRGIDPPSMKGHAATIIGDTMFVCSFHSLQGRMIVLKLNLLNWEWSEVSCSSSLPVREFHALSASEKGLSLILSGGRTPTPAHDTAGKIHGDAWLLRLYNGAFELLPAFMWAHIFSFCDPKCLFLLSAVCRDFRTLVESDQLWARFIPQDILDAKRETKVPLKALFRTSAALFVYSTYTDPNNNWIYIP
ncbi:hypothetical protein Pelo_9144 [Pelomyxa schiedti]|nr:hypothetical protein Pelo_9144 [Pelomyxa schiedti]